MSSLLIARGRSSISNASSAKAFGARWISAPPSKKRRSSVSSVKRSKETRTAQYFTATCRAQSDLRPRFDPPPRIDENDPVRRVILFAIGVSVLLWTLGIGTGSAAPPDFPMLSGVDASLRVHAPPPSSDHADDRPGHRLRVDVRAGARGACRHTLAARLLRACAVLAGPAGASRTTVSFTYAAPDLIRPVVSQSANDRCVFVWTKGSVMPANASFFVSTRNRVLFFSDTTVSLTILNVSRP